MGKKHGQGTYTYVNGDKYIGEYDNDKKSGQGIYSWSNGNRYEGMYQNDKRNGSGILTMENGDVIAGSFVDDSIEGEGKFNWIDGSSYVGPFVDGKMHGQGCYIFANGDVYTGPFVNNMRHGYGKCNFSNGDIYEGEYIEDEMNGEGKLFRKQEGEDEQEVYEGTWVNGEAQEVEIVSLPVDIIEEIVVSKEGEETNDDKSPIEVDDEEELPPPDDDDNEDITNNINDEIIINSEDVPSEILSDSEDEKDQTTRVSKTISKLEESLQDVDINAVNVAKILEVAARPLSTITGMPSMVIGWVKKEGGGHWSRSIRRRNFVLISTTDATTLQYFKEEYDKPPYGKYLKGELDLKGYSLHEDGEFLVLKGIYIYFII